ncbi:hypothetical protein Cgig2_007675 [Carnegiea gigantea]|uniref:Uncharacterized protein n=1 Tax=Carnegiea gigantea TaxID=171969 RepID=A0A9Q1QBH9_9CARY|nr:hypothetical protein Cgig2_007675 [Carnegiea gigantea]
MRGLVMLSIFSLLCCCSLSEARNQPQKFSPAVVVGTVYCDACFQDDFSKDSHYISGATVAVKCQEKGSRPAFAQKVKTDKQGKFIVHLPFSMSKHIKEIQGCTVKLVKSSEPYCAVASTTNSSAIYLKETKQGKHIFSAGFFTFKPLKQPEICNQKPSVTNSFQGLFPHPNLPFMPSLPQLPPLPELPPLPPLPPLPSLPGLPYFNAMPQNPQEPSKEEMVRPQLFFPPVISPPPTGLPLPPNPLQPAPLLPNPLQPPSPPLIPNPFQPPAPPVDVVPRVPGLPRLPSLPPVPGLTNPPMPPPPASSLPLPPLTPLIPGIPIPSAYVDAKKENP